MAQFARVRPSLLVAALLVAGVTVHAAAPAIPPGAMPDPQAMMALQKSMLAAQAAARQPGDEALSCAAIQKQMRAVLEDPGFKAYQDAVTTAAQVAYSAAAKPAQLAELQAAQARQLTLVLPKVMRAQRLVELGMLKNCEGMSPSMNGAALALPTP